MVNEDNNNMHELNLEEWMKMIENTLLNEEEDSLSVGVAFAYSHAPTPSNVVPATNSNKLPSPHNITLSNHVGSDWVSIEPSKHALPAYIMSLDETSFKDDVLNCANHMESYNNSIVTVPHKKWKHWTKDEHNHAKKYFLRQNTPKNNRKRKNIHDITLQDITTVLQELIKKDGRDHSLRSLVHFEDCSKWVKDCRRGDILLQIFVVCIAYILRINLLTRKFTRFLIEKNGQRAHKKITTDDDELIMMAKSKVAETNMKQEVKSSTWYLDSGCSRHMIGDPTKFSTISYKATGHVTYGDNNKWKIIGIGKIKTTSSYEIKNVLLVEALKHNLLSISQLCDKGLKITFEPKYCLISDGSTEEEDAWLWHKRLAHMNMNQLNKLKDYVMHAEKESKQNTSSKAKEKCQVKDLYNYYTWTFDDNSRYTWTYFIAAKKDTFKVFKRFAAVIQNEMDLKIKSIRSDHGGEFQNRDFDDYLAEMEISHNFPALRTPQQNGVVERKNRALEELTRTVLNERNVPKYFWANVVSTTCYVLIRTVIRSILKLTPYEMLKGRKPSISHLRVFGSKCFVLKNGKENLGKFDSKADETIFIGYSLKNKAYRVYNMRTVEESIHVAFDECIEAIDKYDHYRKLTEEENLAREEEEPEETIDKENCEKQIDSPRAESTKEWKVPKNVSYDNIIGDI
ncbi:hypothetical protein V8G54_033366 [Vigna mungo]|uniref:Integrase catalytic domain-containing protein n=1 Tax=Vigna mungo TaxID=3915 RepID=A0AAQ3RGA1_VIGMU